MDPSHKKHSQQAALEILNNFRMLIMNNKPHIKHYYQIRALHQEVVDAMVKYREDGEFEQKIDTDYAIQKELAHPGKGRNVLRLLQTKFDFNTQVGMQAFYDLQIYKPAPNMNCITEAFIEKHRYRTPEKIEFLHSMLSSRLNLYKIIGTEITEGYVFLQNVFTGEEIKIVDIGLSGNQFNDDVYIYTRIITYHGISFNTGFTLFFCKEDGFIEDYIKERKNGYNQIGEMLRFSELYNHFCEFPGKFEVVTNELK